MRELIDELSLLKYLNEKRALSYTEFMRWVSKRYDRSDPFSKILNECTSIAEGMNILLKEYGSHDFNEEFWLSKIAEDFDEGKLSLYEAVDKAYELLNSKGSGKHPLSNLLYSFVDDYDSESFEQYLVRIQQSRFSEQLQSYNLGLWKALITEVIE